MSRFALRRPTPALIVAVIALVAALSGGAYAAVTTIPHDPSFTARGTAYVPASAINGVVLPVTGPNTSDVVNHGMTTAGSTSVVVPTSGLYELTLAGNCNGGATDTSFVIREGNGFYPNRVDLFLGFEGNPSLAGANTVHLAAGTRLNMVAHHGGQDVNCGATLGATLVSAD